MQTSGNSSSMSGTRVAGAAAVIGLAIAVTGSWVACSPGEPDCTKVSCHDSGGISGETGGTGGTPAGGSGGIKDPVADCSGVGVTSTGMAALSEFETKFIAPRCGVSMCHGPGAVFPPKNLDKPAMVRANIAAGQKGSVFCKTDAFINKADFTKSYILAKISSDDPKAVMCPSGGEGGTRMPNKTDPSPMPTVPGDKLMDGEIACFTWYLEAVAGLSTTK
jgi:hypothetical protein